MAPISERTAYALMVVFLIVGIAIGYGVAGAMAPAAPPPEAGEVTTVTKTVTQTVTQTAAAAGGLQGEVGIGALLSLTGALSSYGENSKVALELAEKEINEWLAARGAAWRIKVYIEDTATDPKTALDKIQALHGKGIQIFIGPMTSAEVSEVKSYADANGLLVVSQSSTSPALSIPGDSIFRYCPDDTIQGPAAARVLWEQGVRWVVPVWRGDTWGDGLKESSVEAFKKLLEETGEEGGVHEGIRYDPNAKEFSAEAAKLAQIVQELADKYGKDKVGVLYIGFEEVVAFFAAAKAHPILSEVKWVGSDGTAGLAPLVQNPDAAEFAVKTEFLNPIFAPAASPHLEKLKKYVHDKLGRNPDSYAYAAYDALWTIAIALDMVDTYDAQAVKKVLPYVVEHYVGASGFFELNENGDRAYSDYELWIPRKVGGEYKWDVAGVYRWQSDSIDWSEWWLKEKGG